MSESTDSLVDVQMETDDQNSVQLNNSSLHKGRCFLDDDTEAEDRLFRDLQDKVDRSLELEQKLEQKEKEQELERKVERALNGYIAIEDDDEIYQNQESHPLLALAM